MLFIIIGVLWRLITANWYSVRVACVQYYPLYQVTGLTVPVAKQSSIPDGGLAGIEPSPLLSIGIRYCNQRRDRYHPNLATHQSSRAIVFIDTSTLPIVVIVDPIDDICC